MNCKRRNKSNIIKIHKLQKTFYRRISKLLIVSMLTTTRNQIHLIVSCLRSKLRLFFCAGYFFTINNIATALSTTDSSRYCAAATTAIDTSADNAARASSATAAASCRHWPITSASGLCGQGNSSSCSHCYCSFYHLRSGANWLRTTWERGSLKTFSSCSLYKCWFRREFRRFWWCCY